MTCSYNRLWKLLIDKRMMKTKTRKVDGINTNILVNMGKDEFVALDSLEKIKTYRLNDIIKVNTKKKRAVK